MGSLLRAFKEGDFRSAADWCESWFGVRPSEATLEGVWAAAEPRWRTYESDFTAATILRWQLDLCPRRTGPPPAVDEDNVTCRMHVFFVHLEETPEMLARLPEGKRTKQASPQRSVITATQAKIAPIDRTAAAVCSIRGNT